MGGFGLHPWWAFCVQMKTFSKIKLVQIAVAVVFIATVGYGAPANATSSNLPTILAIAKNHQLHDTSPDILLLQQFLDTHGFAVAFSGPGSLGHETTYFGLATFRALKKFQSAQGLPTTGFLGPLTRIKIATLTNDSSSPLSSSASVSTTPTSTTTATSTIPQWYTQPTAPGNGYTPGYGGGGGDTTPPVINGTPSNITTEATSASGAAVTYTLPTATDNFDGTDVVSCAPASGATFALGITTVTCSSTDRAGNSSHTSFTVTVQDTTAPTITGTPSNSSSAATSPAGAIVIYTTPTASDLVDGTDAVACLPTSGSTFALGVTTVTCTATDKAGNSSNSSFTITVQDTSAPSVSISAPSNGATVGGSSVALAATASDSIVAVSSVQFEVDTTNIGSAVTSSPYTTSWNSNGVADGAHTLYAVAKSASGNYATSSVSVTVRNSPPVISSIASSTAATTATVTWSTDENATSKVAYGATSSYGSATSSVSLVTSHSVVVTGLTSASTYHFAVVSTDSVGNTATSSDHTFVTSDVTPPTVSLTAPMSGEATSSTMTLAANASDNVAVAGVTFYLNGVKVGSEITSAPYMTTYNTTATSSGSYSAFAVARDTSNNYATSTSVSFTINNTPPVISAIASSTAATTAMVTWSTDKNATSKVVYGTTSSYGSATSSASLVTSHSIGVTGLSASTSYHYAVVSADTQGNTATSSDQTFTTLPSWVSLSASGVVPSVYADFTTEGAANHYWYNNQSYGGASALLTAISGSFARSFTAYGQTSAGVLTSFGSGAMRLTDLGLLIESSATNLGFPSEQGASFFPSSTNASIANSSTVGPNGSTTFYSTASTTVVGGDRQKNVTVANDSGTYQDSIFVASKSGGQTVRWLAGLVGGTSKQSFVDFNITTGAITAGTGVVQAVSGGWRVSINITNNSTGNTTLYSELFPAGGSGSGVADFGGFQLEKQSVMSSYIPTTSGTATRVADVLTRTGGTDLSAASGEVDISAHTSVGTSTQVLWQRDDGTQNNRFTIYRDSSRFIHFVIVAGGVTQSDRTIQIIADDTDFTVSMAWSGTLASYTVNTGTPFIEAAVTLPTGITAERLGEDTSGNQWGGRIKSFASYPSTTISPLTFYDSFNRANTVAGTMSNPPVGSSYGFYGPWAGSYPLPAATDGYISGKGFVEDQNNVTYMEQDLGHPVASVTGKLSWMPSNGSTGNDTAGFLIYNTAGNIDSCIHIQIYRTNMLIQKRVGGTFTTLATFAFTPSLSENGTVYDANVSIAGSTVTLTVNGNTISATDPFLATVDGNYLIWENYMIDSVDALKIQAVSAQ
jgi:hypothetical protein